MLCLIGLFEFSFAFGVFSRGVNLCFKGYPSLSLVLIPLNNVKKSMGYTGYYILLGCYCGEETCKQCECMTTQLDTILYLV